VPRVAAVILAGGRGERLGGEVKANIEIGGVRLIERVVIALASADPILVARGAFSDDDLPLPPGTTAIADAPGVGGPLAGIAGAVAWLGTARDAPDLLLSVAVDTPFFPPDFLSAAVARIGRGDAVVAQFDGQDYPTNALWRLSAVRPHLRAVTSPKGLVAEVRSKVLDWSSRGGENPFANLNTPADREALEQRAAAQLWVGNTDQNR
jgi:molybdopterin-guanine dinucleotide biosynthesis protein A